jgi:hypothetical protein
MMLFAVLVGPVLGVILGAWLDRTFQQPKLFYYLGHVSAFRVTQANPPLTIHTHSMIIRNAGRAVAHNVRLAHTILPVHVNIDPPREYNITPQNEVCLPLMVPGDLITVSYLYFPPLTWNQTNTTVRSDEGFGKQILVLPARQYSKRFMRLFAAIVILGWIALLYLLVEIGIELARTYHLGWR